MRETGATRKPPDVSPLAGRLRGLFAAVLARLRPDERTAAALESLDWAPAATVLVAAGKAAPAMAAGALAYARGRGLRLAGGLVIGVEGMSLPDVDAGGPGSAGLRSLVSSHPVPDERAVAAAEAAREAVANAPAGARVLALISGGTSALMAMPAPGLDLAEKVAALRAVAAAGVDIRALNTVRKHLSAIKGGQLLALAPVPVTTLVASDIIGDDIAAVGSGPTVPDPTTFRQACDIVVRAVGWQAVSRGVRAHLEAGAAGQRPDTLARGRSGDRSGDQAVLVAGTGALLEAAVMTAQEAGMSARVFARDLVGDVADAARRVAVQARAAAAAAAAAADPVCLIGGGEPTIALPPAPGVGGRAQQVALLVARDIAGVANVAVLVAGSDGVDGTGPAAGAVVDGGTWQAVIAAGVDPARALARCDAGAALDAARATVVTGPTGVNHADLVLIAAVPDLTRSRTAHGSDVPPRAGSVSGGEMC